MPLTVPRDVRLTIRLMLMAIVLFGVGVLAIAVLGSQARYRDVSTNARYAPRVGQTCVVLKGLRAHGWSKTYADKVTEAVDVTTLPGIAGPEITFETALPPGTSFVITSVHECWNCPFDRISYGMEVPALPELKPYKVFGRAEIVDESQASCLRP